jgi:hypothetical protein
MADYLQRLLTRAANAPVGTLVGTPRLAPASPSVPRWSGREQEDLVEETSPAEVAPSPPSPVSTRPPPVMPGPVSALGEDDADAWRLEPTRSKPGAPPVAPPPSTRTTPPEVLAPTVPAVPPPVAPRVSEPPVPAPPSEHVHTVREERVLRTSIEERVTSTATTTSLGRLVPRPVPPSPSEPASEPGRVSSGDVPRAPRLLATSSVKGREAASATPVRLEPRPPPEPPAAAPAPPPRLVIGNLRVEVVSAPTGAPAAPRPAVAVRPPRAVSAPRASPVGLGMSRFGLGQL